jgi:hypothetical protein
MNLFGELRRRPRQKSDAGRRSDLGGGEDSEEPRRCRLGQTLLWWWEGGVGGARLYEIGIHLTELVE